MDDSDFVSEREWDFVSEQQYEDYLAKKAQLRSTVREENRTVVQPLIDGIAKLLSILGA